MIQHPTLLIIDGMSQAYRAYFATPPLSTSQGIPTNAVYVFVTMLKRVLQKYPPEYIAVALDSPAPTLRHAQFEAYKATRKKMPPDLAEQIPYIRRFCEAMKIPVLAIPGYEADDIIATLSTKAVEKGLYPLIVTLDKDLCQLVDTTLVLNTSKDDLLIDRDKVKEIYGVPPEQITDLLGLMGDTSDNIPGAPGIGPKTALDLISRFGSLEAALDRAAEVKAPKQRASLQENREQILLSKKLVTVDRDVPFDINWDDYVLREPDRGALMPLLKELEFNALIKDYLGEDTTPATELVQHDDLPSVGEIAFLDVRGDRMSVWTGSGSVTSVPLDGRAASLLTDTAVRKVVYDVKNTILQLRARGLELLPPYEDVLLMAYLLNPNRGKYDLTEIVFDAFGQGMTGDRTPWIQKLYEHFQPEVARETEEVYRTIELPLCPVLATVEQAGIAINTSVLEKMSVEMGVQLEDLTRRIYAGAGCEFNLNSPKQLGEVLFEKMNMPLPKKLKKSGQYSTAVEVLEELAQSYEMPKWILEYRQFSKFKSTYVDVIPGLIDP